MRTLHQHLHLQHHRHTGKLLHHKHTSYRGLAVVLGLATACIIGLNALARTTADDIHVYASNPAPIPAEAAVITSPADGTSVANSVISVSGTCPDITPHVIIAILDNGTLVGSDTCDDGAFGLPVNVTPGANTLIARIYTVTGDAGLDSEPVRITYAAAVITVGTDTSANGETSQTSPLTVTIDKPFILFGPAQDAIWSGTITGGTLPYHVHFDWGDGSSSDYQVTRGGHQNFQHHYRAMHPYTITLHVMDAEGRSILRTYSAITLYTPPVIGGVGGPEQPRPFQGSISITIYGVYLILLSMFGYLWTRAHHGRSFAYARVPAQRQARPHPAAARRKTQRKTR